MSCKMNATCFATNGELLKSDKWWSDLLVRKDREKHAEKVEGRLQGGRKGTNSQDQRWLDRILTCSYNRTHPFVTEFLEKLNAKEQFKIFAKVLPWESERMVASSTRINGTKRWGWG